MRHLASLVFIVAPTWALAQPDSGDMLTTNIPSYLGVTIALMILVIAINGLFVAAAGEVSRRRSDKNKGIDLSVRPPYS